MGWNYKITDVPEVNPNRPSIEVQVLWLSPDEKDSFTTPHKISASNYTGAEQLYAELDAKLAELDRLSDIQADLIKEKAKDKFRKVKAVKAEKVN